MLWLLSGELTRLRKEKRRVEQHEALETDATVASLSLPSGDVVTKHLRYEGANDRKLARAWARLEHLQAARLRGVVPPGTAG